MFRVTLACACVMKEHGPRAAADIEREFADHRPHHQNVTCRFDGVELILVAENDYDSDGEALVDEFSDCISAYIATPLDAPIRTVAVERLA
jgi:hypothetical protein